MEPKKEDALISAILKSIQPWKNYIIIGGGYALIIYRLYLAEKNSGIWPTATRDIDSLIPRKIPNISKKTFGEHLRDEGFRQTFKNYENPAVESYSKEFNAGRFH